MESESGGNRITAYVICFVILLGLIFPIMSFAEEHEKVKVGWYIQSGYQEVNSEGEPKGYNYEYLMNISQHTGWEYEFVMTNSFAESYNLLKSGEIDLMGYTLYSQERAQEVLYPEQYCGYVSTSVFVRNDSSIAPYDFEAFDGMRIACIESYNPEYLKAYAQDNNFDIEIVYYASNVAVSKAVADGAVDGGLSSGYQPSAKTRIVASFSPKPFYFIVNQSKPEVLDELNKALNFIRLENPFFDRDLAYRYLPEVKEKLHLTKAEAKYIKENPTWEVSYFCNWPPVSDNNKAAFTGISADIFERISEMTGIRFQYKPVIWGSEEASNATIRASIICDGTTYVDSYKMSNAYLTVPLVLVTKKNAPEDKARTTAVPQQLYDSYSCDMVKGTEIHGFEEIEDCLKAVESGAVDQALVSAFALEYFAVKANYDKTLQSTYLYDESYSVSIGVNDNQSPILISILNKSLDLIKTSDINAMIYNNTAYKEEITLSVFFEQLSPTVILWAIVIFIGILALLAFLLSRQVKYARRIKKILYTDELTGCMSYKGFVMQAPDMIKKMTGKKAFIIDFDINHFGNYNVINGHQSGNEVLCTIGRLATEHNLPGELFARIQADHFICLAFSEDLEAVVRRIKEGVNRFREQSTGSSLRISYGIYEVMDREVDIVSMCEGALAAKRTIKGSYERYIAVYDEDVHKKQLKNTELLEGFNQAVQDGVFVHHFQPKYDIRTLKIVGAEALVRWTTPEDAVIMPEKFIDLFESNGLISKLDLHMFEVLCKKLSEAIQNKENLVPISINFSRVHLFDENFVTKLETLINKYQVPAKLIEIEITETAFAESLEVMRNTIEKLHKVGFSVSIDDFGSGFSSLNTLKDVEFDVVKLDRGFLSSAGGTERGEKVISNIITLAHDLNLGIIAEGVENEEQYQMLKRYGCDMVQGYYFSKPVHEEAFRKLLLNQGI